MDISGLVIFVVLMALGYIAGTMAERKHYKSIERREAAMLRQPIVTYEDMETPEGKRVRKAKMVTGSAVISTDYFKRFLASLRFFFGGRVKSYESLLDRARREAIIRMKQEAVGAKIILGMRIETSNIGSSNRKGKNKGLGAVEALAYGTAVWFDEIRPQTP